MNVIPYFACVALGITISETYHFRNKIAEQKAYDRGFKRGHRQALKEIKADDFSTSDESHSIETEEPKRKRSLITESFMDDLHTNGRAVIKFGGASNE